MNDTSTYYFLPTDDGFNLTHVFQKETDWYWDMFLLMPLGILKFTHKQHNPKEDYEARGFELLPEEVGKRMLKRFDETIDYFTSCFMTQMTGREKQEADKVFFFIKQGKPFLLRAMRNGTIYKLEFGRTHIIYKRMSDFDLLENYDLYHFDPAIAAEMIRAYRQFRKYLKEERQSFLSSCPF